MNVRQRILLIILGVVILLAIYTFFIRPKPAAVRTISSTKARVTDKAKQIKEQAQTKTPTKEIAKVIKEPVKPVTKTSTAKPESTIVETQEEKGKWGTDPFIRDWVLGSEITDLKLKAITESGIKAYALINDQILEVGEVISGKRIVTIEKDKVILQQGTRTFTLLLGQ